MRYSSAPKLVALWGRDCQEIRLTSSLGAMSIAATMQEAAAFSGQSRVRGALTNRLRERPTSDVATSDQPASTLGAIASELTRYIPTEAVAIYTAILPFLLPKSVALNHQSYTSRWWLAGAVGFVAVLYGVGVFRQEVRARNKPFHWPIRRTLAIVVAYAGWVSAIPGSPLNAFHRYTPSLGAVLGIGANVAITLGLLWFGGLEDPDA
jgi:hypothetical protein